MKPDLTKLLPRLEGATESAGKTALTAYWRGDDIGRAAAMKAKCCECMGYFRDGRVDCRVPSCPLYPWMPYRDARETASPTSSTPEKSAKEQASASRTAGEAGE